MDYGCWEYDEWDDYEQSALNDMAAASQAELENTVLEFLHIPKYTSKVALLQRIQDMPDGSFTYSKSKKVKYRRPMTVQEIAMAAHQLRKKGKLPPLPKPDNYDALLAEQAAVLAEFPQDGYEACNVPDNHKDQ